MQITATNKTESRFVRASAIAKRYDVTERSVFNWAAAGLIPFVRIGEKTIRFDLAAVVAKLESSRQ